MLHQAEKDHILGMITMMRQAINNIETVVINSGITETDKKLASRSRNEDQNFEETRYLDGKGEAELDKIFSEALKPEEGK